jgi:glyoxylase-like metal-dependent hydrolase (beta-lactamase superfamily II)
MAGTDQIVVTGTRQRQAWVDRVLPPVERVRPGLWSIPVPIPNNPLRYVLVYAIELPDGVAVVDTGWPADSAWDALIAGLTEVGYAIGDVRSVLVTHYHPDHSGLAGRVRRASGAWVGMHPKEAWAVTQLPEAASLARAARDWLVARGAPDQEAREEAQIPFDLADLAAASPDRLIEDGDFPLAPHLPLRAVWTPGHTAGHLCFFDEGTGLLLSGDHVLPRISPNISLMSGAEGERPHAYQPVPDDDVLGDFLESLALVAKLPVEEVLPAHEYRFRGLTGRVQQLLRHHERRLAELESLVAANPDSTTWELAAGLHWSRPWPQLGRMRRAAIGETLAHLVLLHRRARVVNVGRQVDRWRIAG